MNTFVILLGFFSKVKEDPVLQTGLKFQIKWNWKNFNATYTLSQITRVPHVKQNLLTVPKHLRSALVFGVVPVTKSIFFYVFCVLLLVCLSYSFFFNEFDCPCVYFAPLLLTESYFAPIIFTPLFAYVLFEASY